MMDRHHLQGLTPRQVQRVCTLEAVAGWNNLFLAAAKARRGKSRRPDVENWWLRRETELAAIREELLARSWRPGPYRLFTIHEPKLREIAAAPFRDRVVHHALCNLLGPVLERRFIARSFSCQISKGTTAARECCRQLTNQYRYVLKCDIRKFFPSIDHKILRAQLTDWIECPGAMEMVDKVLGSFRTGSTPPPAWFDGDDLFAANRPRGLPIGNLTSQLWGNFHLDGIDHWIVETKRHGAYLRYTDDFLLFGDEKRQLWDLREEMVRRLAGIRLKLSEPKSRLLTTEEGVPFCGFRFVAGRRPRVLGATKRRFERRRTRLMRARRYRELTACVFAWYQFSKEGDSVGLRRAWASRRDV